VCIRGNKKFLTKVILLAKENLVDHQYLLMSQLLVEDYRIDIFDNHHEEMVEYN
jgi:hypothetical protein